MTESITVPIALLRDSASMLIDHLERVAGEEIQLNKDYYWEIPSEQRFDPHAEPLAFTLGQLSECVDNLRRMTSEPSSAVAFGPVWFGELCKTIGEDVVR